jgi:transposase-like protein
VDAKNINATTEHLMVDWEPITYKDLIILTEWMAQQGYSAARLAEAVREPAKYTEELRAVVRHNSDIAARQKERDRAIQKQAAAEFMAARSARNGVDTPALP